MKELDIYIAIEGPIGVGKTSLAKLIADRLNARKVFEKNYLQSQINRFDGNISKTASFIGMERSALHRKLKQLGITEDLKK